MRVTPPTVSPTDFIATFSRQRQLLLARAGNAITNDESSPASHSSNVVATQCLMTSLEELKVAEEEMLNQHLELIATKAETDRQITYWRTLFDLAPVPLMLSTSDGVIRTANQAMATLLTRPVYHLEGKPLVALLSGDSRLDLRARLRQVVECGGVSAWEIVLDRRTREPIRVVATIQLVPSALTGTTALYWTVREATT